MTDRVFEDQTSFEVSNRYADVEFYLFESREVKVNVTEVSASWDSQNSSFIMTAEEATRLKEFLILKGY
jgi:hypothetical protein